MITAILDVFESVGNWIVITLTDVVVPMFWASADSELTFFGVLAVAALGVSLFFLLVRVVQNFLHFRS